MASLTDNIMQQLSSFLHQRLSSVAQEMLVQVEKALILALDKERAPDLQTPAPAAPEADRTFTDGDQPTTRSTHEAQYDSRQEFVCESRLGHSEKAQVCVKEEEPVQGLDGFIEPISGDAANDEYDDEGDEENGTTVIYELQTDLDSYSDNSNDSQWVGDGPKPLKKKLKTECEQPVIAEEKTVTQSEEKPFICDVCGKGFKRKRNVIVHQRTHTGERPYQCEFCNRSFTQNSDLKSHRRTHTGERPYQCDFCSKSFTQIGALNTHKRIHTGEKPYQCNICNETFMYSSHFKVHRLTHTGEKPYSCDVCGKTYTQNRNLKAHKCVQNLWMQHHRQAPAEATQMSDLRIEKVEG